MKNDDVRVKHATKEKKRKEGLTRFRCGSLIEENRFEDKCTLQDNIQKDIKS
jgi:hypothetical protein